MCGHLRSTWKVLVRLSALALTLGMITTPAAADYNANLTGVVTAVLTYSTDTRFYVRLDTQPNSHPSCDSSYFAVDAALSNEVRAQLYARALLALATQQPVNIGYDNAGNCAHSKIRIHRIG